MKRLRHDENYVNLVVAVQPLVAMDSNSLGEMNSPTTSRELMSLTQASVACAMARTKEKAP